MFSKQWLNFSLYRIFPNFHSSLYFWAVNNSRTTRQHMITRISGAVLFMVFACIFSVQAQTTASRTLTGHGGETSPAVVNLQEDEGAWSFFLDEQNQVYFIDFESLPVTLSEVLVKDLKGKVRFRDDVATLPVNTIYELSYSDLSPGVYDVELHSYTKILKRRIIVH